MPLSWTTVSSHVAGDVLPLADWNVAAGALNNLCGTWVNQGLVGAAGSNGAPPFFAYFGTYTGTTGSSGTAGYLSVTIPGGGFPNGVCMAIATVDATGGSQNGYTAQCIGNASTSSTVEFFIAGATGTAISSTSITIQYLIIGY